MFCFCSNEMQPCRIWGAKQKLNPIANNPCLYTLHPHSSLIVHNLLIAYKQYYGTIICSACFMQVTLHGPLMSMTIPSASKD